MTQPVHEIEIVDRDRRGSRGRGRIVCVLGQDIQFDQSALEAATFTKLDDLDMDLLVIVATIAYVDRLIRRRPSAGWARRLDVRIPVFVLDVWERFQNNLVALLRLLTGDVWTLQFYQREERDELGQTFLPGLPQSFAGSTIIPYSGGLDSYAVLAQLRSREKNAPALLVNARRERSNAALTRPPGVAVVGVPFRSPVEHGEPSYRSRTFTFYTLAALAWRRNSGKQVWIGESGIGSIGPSLVPFGLEHPVRGSHPSFTAALTEFLAGIWGSAPRIEFPNLWKTKGMVLRELRELDATGTWESTVSCSRNHRRQHPSASGTHCGLCTGCLFRRVSLLAGGLPPETDTYFEDVMRTAKLSRRLNKADREVAYCGVIAMDELARVRIEARVTDLVELSCALQKPVAEVTENLKTLLAVHREEWRTFIGRLPRKSWMRSLTTLDVAQ